MDRTRKWLAVLAAVLTTSACSDATTTPTPAPPTRFTANGEGNGAVNIPDTVTQLQVVAVFPGPSATFVVWIGPLGVACGSTTTPGCRLLVNQQLGASTNQRTYTSVVSTGSGGTSATDTLTITSSDIVNWSFVQVQP